MAQNILPDPWSHVKVTLNNEANAEELLKFTAFRHWLKALEGSLSLQETDPNHFYHEPESRYSLQAITIKSVKWFVPGAKIGFIKMDTVINNGKNKELPGTVFLRGGSVAVLMIVRHEDYEDEKHVIMTQQPRVPAGSLSFYEIPAGMIDDEGLKNAAIKEMLEETGLKMLPSELTDMTALALEDAQISESHLERAMYPSPGGCDEYIALFHWDRILPRQQWNNLQKNLMGTGDEQIRLKLVRYEELWKEGARDAKTLAAWALYEGLTREGRL